MVDFELAKRMKSIARKRKLKYTELAARMGMDYQKIYRTLSGRAPAYAQDLPRFAEALETSVEALLGLEGK